MNATTERIDVVGENCPRCDSPKPHHHPAVQFEGEVQPCPHEWHRSTRLGREAWERLPESLRAASPTGPEPKAEASKSDQSGGVTDER